MPFEIRKGSKVDPSAVINVKEGFLGEGTIVRAGARIEGTRVEIGRESFIDYGATIGGGSCFDPDAFLVAGHWLHMGMNSQINIARGVQVGQEFGCGIETKIFTHGAYTDSYDLGAPAQWAPVTIGDRVWLPNAWVNPGVDIGDNVIVAARSLVNRSLPSGCLAGGVPASILKEHYLPKSLSDREKEQLVSAIVEQAVKRFRFDRKVELSAASVAIEKDKISIDWRARMTTFLFKPRAIEGTEEDLSNYIKDQLRRNGIRFPYAYLNGRWVKW